MPLYEYRCPKCDRAFERIQKFSDRPRAKCPDCGGNAKRQLSASSIRFKGTGWYVTDYAGKGSGKDTGDAGGSEEKGSPKDKGEKGAPEEKRAAKEKGERTGSEEKGPAKEERGSKVSGKGKKSE